MPLIRRIPKRGFNALDKDVFQTVNVESLNRFAANAVVGPLEFKNAGFIGSDQGRVKILGTGKLSKALTIKVHAISESAKKLVEASGSKLEIIK